MKIALEKGRETCKGLTLIMRVVRATKKINLRLNSVIIQIMIKRVMRVIKKKLSPCFNLKISRGISQTLIIFEIR